MEEEEDWALEDWDLEEEVDSVPEVDSVSEDLGWREEVSDSVEMEEGGLVLGC